MRFSKKLKKIPPYLFATIDKKMAEMKAKGVDIISLGIGDPDLPTPQNIFKKMHEVLEDPKSGRYPPYEGIYAFRKAVADWYKKRFGVTLDADKEVVSLIGSKEGIAHIFPGVIDPGDVVLTTDPGYPVYKMGTLLARGIPYSVPLKEKDGFLPNLESIPKNILKKAKMLFVNYPNNPTGAVCDLNFLKEVVKFAKKYDLLVCSDLAYSEVSFDGYVAPSILQVPGGKDVAIEFHSLSKTYNMTGWRIGMAVGNAEAIKALSTIKTNVDSGIFKAIQYAGIEALTGPQDCIRHHNAVFRKRRDVLISGLRSLGWKIEAPKATFYVWARVPKGYTSVSFCEELLTKCGILIVPGNGYGKFGEGYFRAAITIPEERISEAIQRMRDKKIRF
jgi:LL-diaminopimelate aminotransferase